MSSSIEARLQTTRRGFLKVAGAALGGAAVADELLSTSSWLKPAPAMAQVEEKKVCTFHQGHCGGRCPIQCTVRDSRLVMIEPNPNVTDDRYRTMCMKGVSELEHIYGEHRIQSPLKRVGERGTNDFEAISWDQALTEIADKLKEIQGTYGKGSVAYYGSSEGFTPAILPELCEFGQFINEGGVDIGIANGIERSYGYGDTVCYGTSEARDWVNSNMVLVMGSNYLETSLTTARVWFEAKEAGTRFVVVDPNFSTTAGKADEWVPIQPATDAAFVLGMVSCILDEKLYDEKFVRTKTSLPFLVDVETGKILRDHEAGYYDYYVPDENSAAGNPFYVIQDGKPVPYDTVKNPPLSGTITHEGRTYCTQFDLLVKNQKPYTLEWAESITHVPAEKIAQIARDYANGPCTFVLGWGGNEKYANADIAGHATALAVALTGNIGRKGAGVGCYTCGLWNGYIMYIGAWDTGYVPTEEPAYLDMTTIRNGESNVHAIMGPDWTQKFANLGLTEEWAKTLDLTVTFDPYYTEATRLSDYVLPICTRFELEEEYGAATNGYNSMILQQKVIEPLFESKTLFQFQKELCAKMGFDVDKYFPKSMVEYNDYSFKSYTYNEWANSMTTQKLIDAGNWIMNPGSTEPRVEFTDGVFYTASGRMDIYYDDLVDYDQQFPNWEQAMEVYEDNPLREKYPLTFFNAHSRWRIHNQFHNAKWLDEVFTTRIEVHPDEMASRGLKNGDLVEVFNDRGSFLIHAFGNPAVRRGTTRCIEGCASRYLGGEGTGGYNSVTNDTVNPRGYALYSGPQTPFSDSLVDIRKA